MFWGVMLRWCYGRQWPVHILIGFKRETYCKLQKSPGSQKGPVEKGRHGGEWQEGANG